MWHKLSDHMNSEMNGEKILANDTEFAKLFTTKVSTVWLFLCEIIYRNHNSLLNLLSSLLINNQRGKRQNH